MNKLEFVLGVALISIVSSSAFIVLKSRVSAAHDQQVLATSARQPVAARIRVIVATQEAMVEPRVPMQMLVAP